MHKITPLFALLLASSLHAQDPAIQVEDRDDAIQIDTGTVQAKIRKKGYVSGIASGTFIDKKTGAREIGFGLHIMDFLLGPGW